MNDSIIKFEQNKTHTNNILIKDFENRVPLKAFLKRRGEGFRKIDTSIVWQKKVPNLRTGKNEAKINSINCIYQIVGNRFDFNGYIDTLENIKETFLRYQDLKVDTTSHDADSILIYYEEHTGGSCCPYDSIRDKQTILQKFNTDFENKHQVKLGPIYYHSEGDEGEFGTYFTLSGLTLQQKVDFMYERSAFIAGLLHRFELLEPTMFRPYWVTKKSFEKIKYNEVIQNENTLFTAVDSPPVYRHGKDKFIKYLKRSVSFKQNEYRTVISFVVERDGSLSNAKTLRNGNKRIEEEIAEAIKKSPKWIPGKSNGTVVRVLIAISIEAALIMTNTNND